MPDMIDRRTLLVGAAATPLLAAARFSDTFAWAAIDRASGRVRGEGLDARMPMCSTFKWLLAACVLARVDRGEEGLDRPVRFDARDLLEYAPTVRAAIGRGVLPVRALCEGAVSLSDNSAANLLLARVGGPAGLTRWLRSIGDDVTRLDRIEPGLNHVAPGDVRDTTTPRAMAASLDRVLFGAVLRAESRALLTGWMLGGRTGDARLRAGAPAGWRVAEKTGTFGGVPGERSASGDVGALFPPTGAPIVVAAYATGFDGRQDAADRRFAMLARRLANGRG